MAPKPKPKRSPGLAARMTRKVGPLPVWAWAGLILAAYYLWSRRRGASSPASSSSAGSSDAAASDAATSAGSDAGAQVPSSGQGSPADNLSAPLLDQLSANTSAIDQLTQAVSAAYPYSGYADAPAATAPAPATATAAAKGAPPAHQTQTTAGVLHWGGLTFTSKAAFDRWARSHGTTTQAELRNHPQARAIYSTLR